MIDVAKVMVVDDRIHVGVDYKHRELCKEIPGAKWSPLTKTWTYPVGARAMNNVCRALVGASVGLQFEGQATNDLVEEARELERVQDVKHQIDLPDIPGKTPAWAHQRQAFHFAKELDGSGLFIDMGGGKTKVCIALAEEWQSQTILVVCPKSVIGVWEKQFNIHGLRQYDVYSASPKMTVARKAQQISAFLLKPSKRPKVVVMNYDIYWRKGMNSMLRQVDWDLIVYDESHKLKAPGGAASKMAGNMVLHSQKRVLMTGTPMPHGPEDIYAQYRACDPQVFGTSFTRFKNKYLIMGGYENRIIKGLNPQNEAEFHRKVGSISIIVTKEDVRRNLAAMGMTIPTPNPPIDIRQPMEAKTDRLYQSMKHQFVAWLDAANAAEGDEGPVAIAENALAKLMRLRQITSGHVKDDEGVVHTVGTEKKEMLEDVLEGIAADDPVIVFCAFHHDLDVVEEVAGQMGRVYGELSGRRRDALAPDSTLAPGVQVAGVQLQSGGVGIDFTASRYAIYYSLDYNLGNVDQSMARLDRPGQKYPVTFIRLIVDSSASKPTVDWVTIQALDERRDMVDACLAAASRKEI